MDKEKTNYYAIIPADVRYCKRISANAKLLFAELTNENFIACGHHYDHALRHNVRFILLGGV